MLMHEHDKLHGFQTLTRLPDPTGLTVTRLKDRFFEHQEPNILLKSVNCSNREWIVRFLENQTGFKHGSSQGH